MKKPSAKLDAYQLQKMKWTARFGYWLFGLLAIITITDILQVSQVFTNMGRALHPEILRSLAWSTIVSIIVGIGTPLIVYFLGERSDVRTKNRYEHHYTGVLFALFAAWLTVVTSSLSYLSPTFDLAYPYQQLIGPAVSIVITLGIAYWHTTHHPQPALNHFRGFQYAFIGLFLVTMIAGITPILTSMSTANIIETLAISMLPVAVALIVLWFGAWASRESSRIARLLDGLIGLTIGLWGIGLVFTLFPSLMLTVPFASAMAWLVGVLAWALYLYLIHYSAPTTPAKKKTRH